MTGLEPHPIFRLPTVEEAKAIGVGILDPAARIAAERAWTMRALKARAERMELERDNAHLYGFRPAIWHVADELLVPGKEVVLVDPDWDIRDPDLIKRRPPDFLAEATRRKALGLGPIVVLGQRELWVAGSNRSSKTEWAAYRICQIGSSTPHARTWSWSDSEEKSQAKQHPIVFKYLPSEWKELLNEKGKARDRDMKMGYGPDGFVANKFSAANGWKHWFNNFKQDLRDVEGDQLNASWHDEERDPERLKTIRVRLGDRSGLLIVTFTSIDESFMAIVTEYESGMTVLLEVEAEWLPLRKGNGGTPFAREPGMAYEKVRRVAVAGPGSDGDQKANILWFHISDNPYYGYSPHLVWNPGDPQPIYGTKAFYLNQNIVNATRSKILSRGYGILTRGALQQFRFNSAIHLIDPKRIPTVGTRYHILDPCPGRNWFMIWVLIDPLNRWFIYREWPSHTGAWPSAYIPGIGDPGPWALPGTRGRNSAKTVYDGVPGAAQQPFRFGLTRYKDEIDRLEGRVKEASPPRGGAVAREVFSPAGLPGDKPPVMRDPFGKRLVGPAAPATVGGEEIYERWMDSRYASAPTIVKEAPTTNIEQMAEMGLDFMAAPSEQNMLTRDDGSIAMINELLDYDEEVDLGAFSPKLGRLNEPRLFVSNECPNMAFALREWTGKDGGHGACKDPADCLRYGVLCDLEYVGHRVNTFVGGGSR